MNPKILVLGNGMLGSTVFDYFKSQNHYVEQCILRYPDELTLDFLRQISHNTIVNTMGAIPQRTNNFLVNSGVPLLLAQLKNVRVIHASTNAVFQSRPYLKKWEQEDFWFKFARAYTPYGESKIEAEEILLKTNHSVIIRASIIGLDANNLSLLSWFLAQDEDSVVNGYIDNFWNGITSLEWAKNCEKIIKNWQYSNNVVQIATQQIINKYEILNVFKQKFNKSVKIKPVTAGYNNVCLKSDVLVDDISQQIDGLKGFYRL